MIYFYSVIITILPIFLISIFQAIKYRGHFLLYMEMNLIMYFQPLFFFVYISFIFLLEIFFLITVLNLYLPTFLIIIQDINFNNTAYCAGVPSIVNLCNERIQEDNILDRELFEYINNNNNTKTLYKYNFSLLNRRQDNLYTAETKKELLSINGELYNIYKDIFKLSNSFLSKENFTNLNQDDKIQKVKVNIKLFIYENIFKMKMIEACNNKLAIPLYNNFYNTVLASKEDKLPLLLESKIPPIHITKEYINPYLIYTDIISIIDFNENNSLQRITEVDKFKYDIVEVYQRYIQSAMRTLSTLNSTNKKLITLFSELQQEDKRQLIGKYDLKLNIGPELENIDSFNGDMVVYNASKLFRISVCDIEPVSLKYQKIEHIFLQQLQKDTSLLRDIKNQRSNMVIDYNKLIKIMSNQEDPKLKEYFDDRTKDRILRASRGDFRLKRPRPF